jgi:hypothetical protein
VPAEGEALDLDLVAVRTASPGSGNEPDLLP